MSFLFKFLIPRYVFLFIIFLPGLTYSHGKAEGIKRIGYINIHYPEIHVHKKSFLKEAIYIRPFNLKEKSYTVAMDKQIIDFLEKQFEVFEISLQEVYTKGFPFVPSQKFFYRNQEKIRAIIHEKQLDGIFLVAPQETDNWQVYRPKENSKHLKAYNALIGLIVHFSDKKIELKSVYGLYDVRSWVSLSKRPKVMSSSKSRVRIKYDTDKIDTKKDLTTKEEKYINELLLDNQEEEIEKALEKMNLF